MTVFECKLLTTIKVLAEAAWPWRMESAESPEAVIAGQQEEGPTSGEAAQVQHNQVRPF